MSVALLHNFDVLKGIFAKDTPAYESDSLEELATALWDTDSPLHIDL